MAAPQRGVTSEGLRRTLADQQTSKYWCVPQGAKDPDVAAGGIVPPIPLRDPGGDELGGGWLPRGPPPSVSTDTSSVSFPIKSLDPGFRAWRPPAVASAVAAAAVRGPPAARVWAAAHFVGFGVAWILTGVISAWQLSIRSNLQGDDCGMIKLYLLMGGLSGLVCLPVSVIFCIVSVSEVWNGPYKPKRMLMDLWYPDRAYHPRMIVPALAVGGTVLQLACGLMGSVLSWTRSGCNSDGRVRAVLISGYCLALVVAFAVPVGAYVELGPRKAARAAEAAKAKGGGTLQYTQKEKAA
eukprot:Hpha_TRINITY_DN34858_c0_g1::TRINITY_DN34858_c0_g1_i1::g.167838::m.167838